MSERTKRALKREVTVNRRVSDVANSMEISPYAVKNALEELGYYKRVARKKPLISEVKRGGVWTGFETLLTHA